MQIRYDHSSQFRDTEMTTQIRRATPHAPVGEEIQGCGRAFVLPRAPAATLEHNAVSETWSNLRAGPETEGSMDLQSAA